MKGKLTFIFILVGLCTLLSTGSGEVARAQQGQDHTPQLDWLFNLDSYQGFEEMPYYGEAPAVDQLAPVTPDVNVPFSKIVFQSLHNEHDWDIFIMDGDGSNQTQLTWETSTDIHPRLNRGCTKIVFASNRAGNYDIYTMNLDGSGITQLTTNKKDDVYPFWSPDGNKIVFQSYRNGNPDVFIMNADGSNQSSLTSSKGFDGMPAWSPEGSQIAFASDRVGKGGIWVMNPDGSGLKQLAGLQYSSFPSWSPDSKQIAFSTDASQNEFLEIYLMDANGSRQTKIYDPSFSYDAWAQSWSPDACYIGFTEIKYIWQNNTWYWTTGYLKAINMIDGAVTNITSNNLEWNLDWRTMDVLAPTSSMPGLLLISPASFTVTWSGYDNGPSGLKSYDVQVRDGPWGTWEDWKTNIVDHSSLFRGYGGHTYYFRVRARDNHYNLESWPADYEAFTTVEAQPPTSSVISPPVYLRNGGTIRWQGSDLGNSGVQSYDLQYRDLATGSWADWLTRVPYDNKPFDGLVGHAYAFRSRATDKAWNLGDWSHPSDPTTLCNFALVGTLFDNTRIPLTDAGITINPGGTTFTNQSGQYARCVSNDSPTYTEDWSKGGYGALPATIFSSSNDPSENIVLPPYDNKIPNWGFEDGPSESNWILSGDITPVVTETARHTGKYGMMISRPVEYGEPISLSQSVNNSMNPQEAFLSDGTALVVWRGSVFTPTGYTSEGIFFTQQDQQGFWYDPLRIWSKPYRESSPHGYTPKLLVNDQDTLYIFWPEEVNNTARILFVRRYSDGSWSIIQPLTGFQIAEQSIPIIDAVFSTNGYIHLTWSCANVRNIEVFYAYCDPDGQSCETRNMGTGSLNFGSHGMSHYIAIDQNNEVSLIWLSGQILYARRSVDGTWTDPVQLSNQSGLFGEQVEIGPDGTVYVLWGTDGYPILYFAQRNQDGTWSGSHNIPNIASYWDGIIKNLVVDKAGLVYVFGFDYDLNKVRYVWKSRDGQWSQPVDIDYCYAGRYMVAQIDSLGYIHATWVSYREVLQVDQEEDGSWSPARQIVNFNEIIDAPYFRIDPGRKINVLWRSWNNPYLFYLGPAFAMHAYTSNLSQSIIISSTLNPPILSFLYQFNKVSAIDEAVFSVQINNAQNSTSLLSISKGSQNWIHAWYNLSPWAGQLVTISFTLNGAAGYPYAWAYLDEVALGSANPDAWAASVRTAALPGEQTTFAIQYGNRGQAIARDEIITVTLPAGLTFISANINPITTGITSTNMLAWDLGDLPANSGPLVLEITVALDADIPLGSSLEIPVTLSPSRSELELANNTSQAIIFVGRQVYLPVTVR